MIFLFILIINIVFIILSLKNKLNYKLRKVLILLLGIILVVIAGFRHNFGFDYANYRLMYEQIRYATQALSYPIEKGYVVVNYYVGSLFDNFHILVFIIAFLSISIKFIVFYKLSPLPLASILVYFLAYYITSDMEQIRHGISISFFMLTAYYVLNSKYKLSILFYIISMSFHNSAIVGLPIFLYPVFNRMPRKSKVYLCGFIILAIIGFSLVDLLKIIELININFINSGYIHGKLTLYKLDKGVSIYATLAMRLLVLYFFSHFYDSKKDKHKIYIFLYTTGIIALLILQSFPILSARGSAYYKIFETFIVSEGIYHLIININNIKIGKKVRMILLISMLSLYFLYNFYRTIVLPEYFNYNIL